MAYFTPFGRSSVLPENSRQVSMRQLLHFLVLCRSPSSVCLVSRWPCVIVAARPSSEMLPANDTFAWWQNAAGVIFRRQRHFRTALLPVRPASAHYSSSSSSSCGSCCSSAATFTSINIVVDSGRCYLASSAYCASNYRLTICSRCERLDADIFVQHLVDKTAGAAGQLMTWQMIL